MICVQAITRALGSHRGDRAVADVAAAVGVSETELQAYEAGRRTPPKSVKVRFSEFYGVGVDTLFPNENKILFDMGIEPLVGPTILAFECRNCGEPWEVKTGSTGFVPLRACTCPKRCNSKLIRIIREGSQNV